MSVNGAKKRFSDQAIWLASLSQAEEEDSAQET